jgi:ATP-dependent DNA ligase
LVQARKLFTKQFPHIASACKRLAPGTLVDGEIVALDESGRVSFNLLQHHRSKAQALLFYAFDVLSDAPTMRALFMKVYTKGTKGVSKVD